MSERAVIEKIVEAASSALLGRRAQKDGNGLTAFDSIQLGPPHRTLSNGSVVATFIATTFLSSTLLFLVQPMFAKMLLPRLGGSAAVWNTCVLFFQTTLLLGYLYAHLTLRWLGARRQPPATRS